MLWLEKTFYERTLCLMDFSKNKAIRWHSRAGQGAVSAAQFFSEAMIQLGGESISFPSFGAEKRGAPVEVFNRVSGKPISDASQPRIVDIVILLEPSLVGAELSHEYVLSGLKDDGILLINTENTEKNGFHKKFSGRVFHVPASKIAFETVKRNVPNVAMIGALINILQLDKDILKSFLKENLSTLFPQKIVEKNLVGFDRGYNEVQEITGSTGKNIQEKNTSSAVSWKNLPEAAVLPGGSSVKYRPGNWLPNKRIKFIPENCIQCGICWAVCPDDAIVHDENGQMIGIDQDACKRCGLCVRSCSANKMAPKNKEKHSLLLEDVPLIEQENL